MATRRDVITSSAILYAVADFLKEGLALMGHDNELGRSRLEKVLYFFINTFMHWLSREKAGASVVGGESDLAI